MKPLNAINDQQSNEDADQRMLIRWFLSLTPMERLRTLEESLNETPPEQRRSGTLIKLDRPIIVPRSKKKDSNKVTD
jgi:hypothetical protein